MRYLIMAVFSRRSELLSSSAQMSWYTVLQNSGCNICRKQLIPLAPGELITT